MSAAAPYLFAVQVLRNLDTRGGTATVHQLASDRFSRKRVRAALQLAAREQLVTSGDGERYTLTQKAVDTILEAKTVAAALPGADAA